MPYHLLKYFFLFAVVFSGNVAFSQYDSIHRYLDSIYRQQIQLSDSLVGAGLFKPARDVLSDLFLEPYLKKKDDSRQKRLFQLDSLAYASAKSDPYRGYREDMYLAKLAYSNKEPEKALSYLHSARTFTKITEAQKEEAGKWIAKIESGFSTDTIYQNLVFPVYQLESQRDERGYEILSLKKEKRFFNGILVKREVESTDNNDCSRLHTVHYLKYQDGKLVNEPRTEIYSVPLFLHTCLCVNRHLPLKDMQYYLYNEKFTREDTVYQIAYNEQGTITSIAKWDNKNSYGMHISYHDPDKKSVSKSGGYSRVDGKLTDFSYRMNEKGDTLYFFEIYPVEKGHFHRLLELNENKDTIRLEQTLNDSKTGLQADLIYTLEGNEMNSAVLKTWYEEDDLVDFLAPELIYTGVSGEIINKEQFITLVYQLEYHFQVSGYKDNSVKVSTNPPYYSIASITTYQPEKGYYAQCEKFDPQKIIRKSIKKK